MRLEAPYHEGELRVQQRAGEAEIAERTGRVIADSIMPRALEFIAKLPMAVLGSVDNRQRVWASLLIGRPGFMTADERAVEFDLTQTARQPHDPLWANIKHTPRPRPRPRNVGALMIELATRRRLRVNGPATLIGPDRLRLDVDEAYPNCPKYIQRRHVLGDWQITEATPPKPRRGRALEPEQHALLASADTLFVASAHPDRGVDASHRGGNPGFVRVLNDTTLRIPDYRGNSMFNTLGNFTVHPHAGLVFPDFERGRILQLTGEPEIQWDLDDPDDQTGGTRRYWDLHIDGWLQTDMVQPPRWELLDYSPHNPS